MTDPAIETNEQESNSSLKRRLAQLSPDKLAALQARLRHRKSPGPDPIRRGPDSQVYPLSYHQQRLWFIEQFQPGTPAYNVSRAVRICGVLNRDALKAALQELQDRHEVLRTTFHMIDGTPVQRIEPPSSLTLECVDLSHTKQSEIEARLQQEITAEARRLFNLAADSMLRVVLFRLGDAEHVLQVTIHHLVCDGWSLALFFRELNEVYSAIVEGRAKSSPPPALRYVDFAMWQRSPNQQELFSQRTQWWQQKLAGGATVLDVPTRKTRPQVESGAGRIEPLELPQKLLDDLAALAQEEDATLFMVLLSGFWILLNRYTGRDDFLVGSATAGRHRPETHDIHGFFVDTFVLRADLAGRPTVREVIRRARETVVSAMNRSDVPFERVVESLQLPRDLSRHPLFQVMFNAPPQYDLKLHDLDVSPVHIDAGTSRFDLEMTYSDGANRTTGMIYNSDIFDAETIRCMLTHYRIILQSMVEEPGCSIAHLPVLTQLERNQQLVSWNLTPSEEPLDDCIYQLFEKQAESIPDTVAVVLEDQQLTYRQLNERSNQLARRLQKEGVAPESVVGLCLERSPEFVIAIVAIHKAGGAYLPVDPDLPRQRVQTMFDVAKVSHIVTRESLLGELPETDCSMTCLDSDAAILAANSTANLSPVAGPEHLAYVMFTSGSSGTPKGVAIEHRSVVNLLLAFQEELSFSPGQRFLGVAAPTFDISVLEMFLPLIRGGTTILVNKETSRDSGRLAEMVTAVDPDIMQATPATWAGLIETGWQANSKMTLISGGEALPKAVATQLLQSGGELYDGYGPTEATIYSTYCHKKDPSYFNSIGRPITGTQVYVLDGNKQLLPVGVPGELYIGGDGLAREYLNQPELTAERFIPNPFSAEKSARIYRTGDLCRWRTDGQLEFLGRLDDQVKLRGFRIELGEIEAVLNQHAAVTNSAVVLREDRPGEKRLVAYFVPAKDSAPRIAMLKEHLRERLPDYMVPGMFVDLPSLPLTASRKINRRALPAPDDTRPDLAVAFVPGRTPLEIQIAAIWRDVLGVDRVGIHDNFFELGGHSLLVTRVYVRLVAVLQVELQPRMFFQCPTVAELAEAIEGMRTKGWNLSRTTLTRQSRETGDLPLSFGQERLWFLDQLEDDLAAYNISFGWRLKGDLDTGALQKAMARIVARHRPLRTTIADENGKPVQHIQSVDLFAVPVLDLSASARQARQTAIDAQCKWAAAEPFDLATDFMLRSRLVKLAEDDHLLLITLHHIAADGWSIDLLWRELSAFYQEETGGPAANLPELPIDYVDFAAWQRKELAGERLERLSSFWRQQLAGVSPLELPTDRPRPLMPSYQGQSVEFHIEGELVDKLRSIGLAESVTLHMTLLAAFQVLLARYSGNCDFAIGTPIAGRNHSDLQDQIGFFVNTLVLRSDLSGDPSFRQLLSRVRETSLAAYDHQDLPFEQLVELLQPERHLNRNPLVQVLFQLLEFSAQGLQLKELDVVRHPIASGSVRCDLEMHLYQRPGEIRGVVMYSTELFDGSTIERLTRHFLVLLRGITENIERSISELPLLTQDEAQREATGWRQTITKFPQDSSVVELFEQHVDGSPSSIAITCGELSFTYAELNLRANQLAHHLRRIGVAAETVVGVCLERSAEFIVSVLAILKAGGAYLPLNVSDPAQRIETLIADAASAHVITRRDHENLLPEQIDRVCLDTDAESLSDYPAANLNLPLSGADLAYVMYTSGSTGEPKGVAVEHRSITRLVRNTDYVQLTAGDCLAHVANVSFDASTFEIWGALLCGGRVAIADDHCVLNTTRFREFLTGAGVTTLFLTTALFNQHVAADPSVFSTLHQVLFGGEVADVDSVRRLMADQPPSRLLHVYGPTENTTFTTWELVEEVEEEQQTIPIGKPIANTTAYLLDQHRRPVPVGVTGELFVGGAGLARGYLNRTELTAERFVSDFGNAARSRMYRTGDLCRRLDDGRIEFVGRIDNQIKLRGYRIELSEIEAALNDHAEVSQSLALLREAQSGDKQIVAYCVGSRGEPPHMDQVRDFLRSRLPGYMLPSSLIPLKSLPMTANGKVNRDALPAPQKPRAALLNRHVPPQTQVEKQLATIWTDVLGQKEIGLHDDFFDLGGHSLLAVRIFSAIEQRFGHRLPVASLFQNKTVFDLARRIAEAVPTTRCSSVIPLHLADGRPLVMMPGMFGEIPFSIANAVIEQSAGNIPIVGIQPPAEPDPNLFDSFQNVAKSFVQALRNHQPHGPYALVGYSFGGMMAYEVASQLWQQGETTDLLAIIDTGPGWRGATRPVSDVFKQWTRVAYNLPFWVREEARQFSTGDLFRRVMRKLRRFYRVLVSRGNAKMEVDDVFGKVVSDTTNSKQVQAAFNAFRDYAPEPYPGRLSLLRAAAQPLLRGNAMDLGWSRLVDHLEIFATKGSHSSIIHPPDVDELVLQLIELFRAKCVE